MRDLSLHLLDLAQNSITAGASLVTVRLTLEDSGMLTMQLEDNGKGMSPELLQRVTSPFATTRTTRKVGLGIPMMKENAEKAGGTFTLESEEGKALLKSLGIEGDYEGIGHCVLGYAADTETKPAAPRKKNYIYHI